jgi:hypothetical protein
LAGTALAGVVGAVGGMTYRSDTGDLEPAVAEVVVFSNDFAIRRERPRRPWATSTRQACRMGRSTGDLVLIDRGVTAAAAHALGRQHGLELRRVGWDDKHTACSTVSARAQIATTLRHLSRAHAPRRVLPAAA